MIGCHLLPHPSPVSPPPPLCTSHAPLLHYFHLLPVSPAPTLEEHLILLHMWLSNAYIKKNPTSDKKQTLDLFMRSWTVSVTRPIRQMLLLAIDLLWFPENSRGFHKFNNASSSVSGLMICSCGHTWTRMCAMFHILKGF